MSAFWNQSRLGERFFQAAEVRSGSVGHRSGTYCRVDHEAAREEPGARAFFDENFVDLESIASEPDPEAFGRLWKRLLEHTIEHAAFVEMVLDARQSLPDDDGDTRLRRLVEHSLGRAKRAGRVTPEVAPDDVLLAQRMAYGW